MPVLIGFLALVLTLYALRAYTRASPAALARLLERAAGAGAVALGLFFILRGRIDAGLFLISVGAWIIGALARGVKRFGAPGPGVSRVRSAMIEMELDHASGAIRGTIL
jgi:hypothetical protein